jgi:hypothetical protein
LLTPEQQQEFAQAQGLDLFADDFQAQLDAYLGERLAPVADTLGQQQSHAALWRRTTRLQASAQELGASVEKAEVRQMANEGVTDLASQSMANVGYGPQQIAAALQSSPIAAYEIVAGAFGKSTADIARISVTNASPGLSTLSRRRGTCGLASTGSAEAGTGPARRPPGTPGSRPETRVCSARRVQALTLE